jgi:hypothetical protein
LVLSDVKILGHHEVKIEFLDGLFSS